MASKRLLLSRGTVLTLIALTAGLMVAASLVPQSFSTPADQMSAWTAAHPVVARVTAVLGLDRVYSHPVFLALILLALAALSLSAWEQLRAASRRTWPRAASIAGRSVEIPADLDTVATALRARGYLIVRRGPAERLLVRHPWGHWGNVLLHCGLAIVVGASAVIGATQQRAALHILEGETFHPGGPWFAEEKGLLARRLVLPFAVRLDHLEYRFWPTYGLESVTSTLTLLREDAPPSSVKVGINDLQRVDGIRIYQNVEIGHAFKLEVEGRGKRDVVTLLVQHPPTPDVPGSNDFRGLLRGGELLRAKYFVNPDARSFETFNPLLVLRVEGSNEGPAEVRLRPGAEAVAGAYRFRLARVTPWARLSFVNVAGIAGVFAGFLVIALGGILHYFTPPREAALFQTTTGATRLVWRAARFADFYTDEYEALCEAAGARGIRG